jgi:hypothetical protein
MTFDKMTFDIMTFNIMTFDKMTLNITIVDKLAFYKMPVDKVIVDKMPLDKMNVAQMTIHKMKCCQNDCQQKVVNKMPNAAERCTVNKSIFFLIFTRLRLEVRGASLPNSGRRLPTCHTR